MEKTNIYKTTLKCSNCIDKIADNLNNYSNIKEWKFNENDSTLIIKGENICSNKLSNILEKEGFKIIKNEAKFWNDNQVWKKASANTLNCLIGCSIGDFGMIIFLQMYYPNVGMSLQMILAIISGLITSITLETIILKIKEKFLWFEALKLAFGMSFISMVGMEISMNITDFTITGGKADFNNITYWIAILISMIVGFISPLPYNYYKLKKYNKSCH